MSQSFEKKVGSRLQHYEPTPPPHLKKKVFAVVSPSRGINGWQVTGVILILSALIQLLFIGTPGASESIVSAENSMEKGEVAQQFEPPLPRENLKKDATNEIEKINENPILESSKPVKEETSDTQALVQPVITSESFGTSIVEESSDETYLYAMIHPHRRGLGEELPEVGEVRMKRYDRSMYLLSKEIKPEKLIPPLYAEAGLFFIYQQVAPNVEDNLIIESFEGESGFSPKRLGVHLEGGIHRQIFSKVRLHGGVKVSTYQQSYRFAFRDIYVDEVEVTNTGDELIFSPIYEEDKIEINHRMYTVGGRLTGNFQIFPSRTTELLIDSEYVKILNSNQSFVYENRTYEVGYHDQWLFSLGMRKTFALNRKGMLQVVPTVRYAFNQVVAKEDEALSMKAYSVGLSVSYIFGNFMK
jgi:hypothetical protein